MNISAVVLAGGKSTRMNGNNKANLIYKDKKFIEIIISALENTINNVYVSVDNKERYNDVEYNFIEDIFYEIGPLGGLYSSLQYVDSEFILVFPCDMPLINKDIIKYLLRNIKEDDKCLILKSSEGKMYPLCGIYSKKSLPIIKDMIEKKDYKLCNLVNNLNGRVISINDTNINEDVLMNVNNPNEYKKLISN